MKHYDPDVAPDPEAWLELDEMARIQLVEAYHDRAAEPLQEGSPEAHAAFHAIVETQVAERVDGVGEAIDRLIRQGLDRHEAVHAVAAVIAEEVYELSRGDEAFDPRAYRARLDKLTVKRWRRGKF